MIQNAKNRPQPGPGATPRTAYLVLGMHRSGTSAITQLLSLAGAQLPKNVMPGDEHNAQGYFEPWRIAIFNDERLRAAGSAWDDIFAFPCPAVADDAAWLQRATALFAEEYAGRRFPLMKDPRVTVLLPFWRQVFDAAGVGLRCVIPVRHPLAVANSLGRRDGFSPQKSLLVWSAYMLAAEAYSRDLPRAFVGYDQLLADWRGEIGRIERDHGAPLPKLGKAAANNIDAALTFDLRHSQAVGDLTDLGWTGEIARTVYDWFAASARDETPDRAALEAAAGELAARQRDIGPLVSPMARDLDATRSDLLSARESLAWDRREMEVLRARFESLQRDWRRRKAAADEVEQMLDAALKD
jgi:hypothetical protein